MICAGGFCSITSFQIINLPFLILPYPSSLTEFGVHVLLRVQDARRRVQNGRRGAARVAERLQGDVYDRTHHAFSVPVEKSTGAAPLVNVGLDIRTLTAKLSCSTMRTLRSTAISTTTS